MTAARQDLFAICDPALLAALHHSLSDLPAGAALGIALSAGPDSAMLALHAARWAREQGRVLHALHVHHGLQQVADSWQEQAHALAALLQINCHSIRVEVEIAGRGMEAAAREARYEALAGMAHAIGLRHILLAHHQDDQAETVLLRLLRGAGPDGLAAMAPQMQRSGLNWLRPWLEQPRSKIIAGVEALARISAWRPVHDPTNTHERYARGALRTRLAPVLDQYWPAWRPNLARHARQARAQTQLAHEAFLLDWQNMQADADNLGFSLKRWRALSAARQVALLRGWLRLLQLRMPTEARLADWLRQLRGVHALGHDRNLRLRHEHGHILVQRGRVLWRAPAQNQQAPGDQRA